VAAGLFVRSLRSASATDLGFDAARLLVVRVDERSSSPSPGRLAAAYARIAERLRSLPRVAGAATTLQIPFAISGSTEIHVPGIDSVQRFGQFTENIVGESYFETTGTRILRGRALGPGDQQRGTQVLVVSDSMAQVLWPGESALGKCVRVGDATAPCADVVGVAANIHQYDVRAEASLQYWIPESMRQSENSGPYGVLVRVDGDPARLASSIRQAVQPLVPTTAYVSVRPVGESVRAVIRPWRLGAIMFGAFGALGLFIAALGLYSVLAYSVGQRRREIGVRTALGARRTSVLRMVLWQGVGLTTAGVAVGLVVAAAAGGRLAPLLIGVGPRDPIVITVVVATLLAAALLASVIPAWRAARVDPALVLRDG
jgi:predicted permease